jgi:hypothetical protein
VTAMETEFSSKVSQDINKHDIFFNVFTELRGFYAGIFAFILYQYMF